MAGWSMLRSVGRRIGVKGVDEGAASVCEQGRANANQIDPQFDDWELAEDEDHHSHHSYDRLPKFGLAPAEKEVQETASDLQDALLQDITPVCAIEHTIETSSSSMPEISCSGKAGILDDKIESLPLSSVQDEVSDSVEAGTFDNKTALSSSSSMHEIFESVEDNNFDHKMTLSQTCLVHEISDSDEAGTIDHKKTSSSLSSVHHEISNSVEADTFDHKTSSSSSSVQDEISSVEADTFDHKTSSSSSSVQDEISSVEVGTFDHKTSSSSSSSVHEISDEIEADASDHETASSSSSMPKSSDLVVLSSIRENWNKLNQMELELHEDNDRLMQNVGRSNVQEAFQLLQNNPAVQRMVMSVASDKAVLDALLKNEKVHEFRQSFQQGELKMSEISKDSDKPSLHQENPFFQAIENIKTKVMEFTEKTTEVINQFIGFTDKKILLEKDGDMDRALKASLILFLALLVTVLVRRV